MIPNRDRLFQGCPPSSPAYRNLRLVDYYLVDPISHRFDAVITGGYRTQDTQANLTDADGNVVPDWRKAKGVSQHVLGEAVDFVCAQGKDLYEFAMRELRPWQAIAYITAGKITEVHLSILSERLEIVSKDLVNVDGEWRWWRGQWPALEV